MKYFIILVIALLVLFFGGREIIGELINKLFPKSYLTSDQKIYIFINGKYNRVATITGITADKIYIYDGKIPLELDFRGRFYAVGIDSKKNKLTYMADLKLYKWVRIAECMRKIFNIFDDFDNLKVE